MSIPQPKASTVEELENELDLIIARVFTKGQLNGNISREISEARKLLTTLSEQIRDEAKEEAYKNVGSWHKVPLIDSDNNRCLVCGSEGVLVRGKYPGYDNRYTCPTCCLEIVESILDSCNNRTAYQSLTQKD